MSSISKKEKDLFKSLDKLYNKDKDAIIKWLDAVKVHDITKDDKLPGLLNNSKIQIYTNSEEGIYNLILKWIILNKDKFSDYNFDDIPDSSYISVKVAMQSEGITGIVHRKFLTLDDVKIWCENPLIHPIKGTPLTIVDDEYFFIYEKAYKILKKALFSNDDMLKILPKNHLLYGNINFVHYSCLKKNDPYILKLYVKKNASGKVDRELFREYSICNILHENLDNLKDKDNILDTEIELLYNRFSKLKNSLNTTNLDSIKNQFEILNKFKKRLFLTKNYIGEYTITECFNNLIEDAANYYLETYLFVDFLENNTLSNGYKILDFFRDNINNLIIDGHNWIQDVFELYLYYKSLDKDISDCFDLNSGIIENYENIKYTQIVDPIDSYFEEFEKKLAVIKNPIYSQLVDITTYKAKNLASINYLNDEDFKIFKLHRDNYDNERKKYESALLKYDRNPSGSSPTPPKKPTITLPSSGKTITIAVQKDPMHIKDDVIKKFTKEYEKLKPIVEEYNNIKKMSYVDLKKYFGDDPTTAEFRVIQNNELLMMDREQIQENILYDSEHQDLNDKCSEEIDILTNEDFSDENYPLAKLQLMVRLKVYTPDRQTYRTECIYAPELYNYLIKCINNKELFVNPITKTKYTNEHIDELMKVIKIIDSSLEVPRFIKHQNDTKLKITYQMRETHINPNMQRSFGDVNIIYFYKIFLSRELVGTDYLVYEICHIPAGIEPTGFYATNSTDLSSSVMLFRIMKLFNEGRLLHNYLPPYCIKSENNPNAYRYIKPAIHFNRYREQINWIKDLEENRYRTKEEFINLFKHYATEINNYC